MLQDVHQSYREAFRESNWLVRFEILYLSLVPVLLASALIYLIAFYMNA